MGHAKQPTSKPVRDPDVPPTVDSQTATVESSFECLGFGRIGGGKSRNVIDTGIRNPDPVLLVDAKMERRCKRLTGPLSSPDGRAAVGTKRCCPLAPAKVDTESHAKQRMATHMPEGLFKNRPRFCHSRVADTGGRASYDPVIQRPDARSRYVARLQAVSSQN